MKPTPPDDAAILLALGASLHRPMHVSEVAEALSLPLAARRSLTDALDALVTRGLVSSMPGSRYRLPRDRGTRVEGRFSQNPKGFGFVTASDGGADVYIPATSLLGAMHGDLVAASATAGARGREGVVVAVLERRAPRIPGVLRVKARGTWVEPDDARLRGPIPVSSVEGARDGQAVVCEITRWPEHPGEVPEGTVGEALGEPGELGVEVRKVILREGVEETFDTAVEDEARAFGAAITPADYEGREDLRALPLVTIDPVDARDHDDAVHVARRPDGGYVATIAIADVSHYVRHGSALDRSAVSRGTSIYLPDRAIPMLPRSLSSHLASLIEGEDRLVLGVEVHLAPDGTTLKTRPFEGVMRCHASLTYQQVARGLGWTSADDEAAPTGTFEGAVREGVEAAAELAQHLRALRMARGALDFDLPEGRVKFGPDGRTPADIVQSRQDPGVRRAYGVVEELMLLANEAVATICVERGAPTIFRTHGEPDAELLERFVTVAEAYGHRIDADKGKLPKKLAGLLKRIHGKPEARVLGMLLLRAMPQAKYTVANTGHFGLASEAYLHFTSPIRRYPDVVVHRVLRSILRGEKRGPDDGAYISRAAAEASRLERRAMDIEREVLDLYRCVVARDRLQQIHDGVVVALTPAGPYVELDSPYISGLLRVESIGFESWEIDALGTRMVAARSGASFALGDPITVQIEDVSIQRRTVYLTLPAEARDRLRADRKRAAKTGTLPKKKTKPEKRKGARKGRR